MVNRTPGSAEIIKFMASKSCQVTSKNINIDLVIKNVKKELSWLGDSFAPDLTTFSCHA